MSGSGSAVLAIFNPASGRGRGARRLRTYIELLREKLPGVETRVTRYAGEEGEIAEQAVAEGYRTIVAAGGDGTWSNVADRLVAAGRPDVRLGLLPSGTGNDFGRNLGLAYSDPRSAVEAIVAGRIRRVDVGRVATPTRRDGSDAPAAEGRHFLNVVGFGFDVAVIDAAAGARFLRGEALYKFTALQQLLRFPGFRCRLEDGSAEGSPPREKEHLMLTISNGCFFGGGFAIAPGARPDDGRLHACAIDDAAPLHRARLFARAQRGRHVEDDGVELRSSASFRLRFSTPPRFEVDGDVHVATESTVDVEVVPAALEVLAAG